MYDRILLQVVLASTLLFGVLIFFLIFFIVKYKNREQQHRLEKQRLLFELKNKELTVSVEERELVLLEVSREIHDNIGQISQLIRMNLYPIEEYSDNPYQLELIQYVIELTARMIEETRHIGNALNSNFIMERGLYRMLEYDMERLNASRKISCSIDVSGDDRQLTAQQQLLVYRIAQEAIHNILRHAEADFFSIELKFGTGHFEMRITDNGKGFYRTETMEAGTMGLQNMQQRARLLNGSLEIMSSPKFGCSVILCFNYHPLTTS